MKKKVFSLMMTLLLAFMGVAKAETIEIGDGTGTTYMVPFNSLYGYSFTEQVFLASEIGTAGNITAISFNLGQSYTSEQTNTIALYMKNVSRATFASNTDYEPVTAADVVYSGSWTIPANTTGWITINLDTPFAYDGTSNLMVAMHESTAGYSTRYFVYTSVTSSGISYYSDSYNPDPYNLDSYSGSKVVRNNRNNIQLEMSAGGGAGVSGSLTLHDGTATNGNVPVYGFYADAYLKAEMVYPAAELSAMNGGSINAMTFYTTSPAAEAWTSTWQVFVSEVADATISSFYGPGTVVYEGALDGTGAEMTINFTTPYQYNGGNLLVGVYNITTGNYKSVTWAGETVTGASVSGYSYSDLNSISATQRNFLPKTTFGYTTAGGGQGGDEGDIHVLYAGVVDTINLGLRAGYVNSTVSPNWQGPAWMEPVKVQMYNVANQAYTVSVLDFTPNDSLFFYEAELPFTLNRYAQDTVDVSMWLRASEAVTGTTLERQFVAIYQDTRLAAVWPITVEVYSPECPDIWELALNVGTNAYPFINQPIYEATLTGGLHNDYNLPFDTIEEGYDAVYKLTIESDSKLDAYVLDNYANGKVALYTEDFYGEGGPMATNYYQGLQLGDGNFVTSGPYEVQIGDGTSTTGYLPFYCFYNYSLSQQLYLGTELLEAGVTTAQMTSISWECSATNGNQQSNITIWMANVEETAIGSTSMMTNNMVKVYEGNMTPAVGWNEFVFNQGNFAWDGHSNILVSVQRNNGAWASGINWYYSSQNFNCSGYKYTDSTGAGYGPFDMTSNSYSWSGTSTYRANIIFKGGNREVNRDVVVFDFENGQIPSGWDNTSSYPWTVVAGNSGHAMKSSNGGVASSTSSISATFNLASDGTISFDAECMGEGTSTIWDKCIFELDGVQQFSFGANVSGWNNYSYQVAAGSHTCTWKYSKDSSVNPTGDYFMVDNVTITTAGGGGFDPSSAFAINYTAGPVIEGMPLTPGNYYLVASSTDENFEVYINVEPMPCPEVEGFAFNPSPADNEDEVEPASVTLRWMIPGYATGWRLIFGSTYHPEVGHPQTIIYPEDGSFSREMANSFTVRNLWNNTNYFWRVEFNNDNCPDGVSGPIWGFTTHLNVPQNLRANDETIFEENDLTLTWDPVVDRTYRNYFIYMDGVKIGQTATNQIGATTYTIPGNTLAYNMAGYVFYVTAVYDEGESAPSNEVTVKVSGRGSVNGYVYEQDGVVPIPGATVTFNGYDEFNASQSFTFTTNNFGYYEGTMYAGSYDGQAAKEGYQTAYAPTCGNPVGITYDVTTTPVNFILDENFNPVCQVIAEYYPDSLDPQSPYVKVYWGCGLPGNEIIEDFETGDFSMFDWQVSANYPWSITTNNPYEGEYCMKSGGAGVANVVSDMSVTVDIPHDGVMSFFGKISCENNWDYGYFYIDGVQKGSYTGAGQWTEREFDITEGEHTFKWQYTKDGSVNSNDDCFYVDYITFYKQPEPPIPGMTYDFENGTMQGWTSLDADGDGYGWYMGSEIMTGQTGNNGSSDFVLSQSYYMGSVLYPDNYLVSPQVQLGGVIRFYACAQDASYAAEHFGVAVSTTTNNSASAFTTIQEWTMTAKGDVSMKKVDDNAIADVNRMGHSREGNVRAQGNWYEYTVDLSAYSGMGYVAIRHFNCSDMFYLNVDDITIGEPSKSAPTRSLNHYRVYRTNCYNDGPYTEENTVLLATVWVPDTVYIDVEWADLPAGVYKWGVGAVYAGNRGELYESPITWTAPQAVRDMTADNDPNPVSGEEGNRAPWDLMTSFDCTSGYQYGVASDGNYIYTSSWSASSTSMFYKYDMQGNFIEEFNISGSGQIRDLTYDGQYFYGVANSTTVYCLDLANHSLVNTFTSGFGSAQRGITYDPQRDGFWVIGNWSGNLTLINRSGAVQFTGPAPTSASGLAYYKDENNVEHVYCFNNGDNCVYDYDIATNTMGGSVFNFSSTPGYTSGSSGGCHVGEYNGMMAFFGDLQQSPNVIGIYELRSNGGGVGPNPGTSNNLNHLALPRESETVWSNCLDKDMYLFNEVSVNVLLNSADSPAGAQVSFVNYNEYEEMNYPMGTITIDESCYYVFESFRKGEYQVTVEFDGYETIIDSVSIWTPMELRYVMTEILYPVATLYVSSTGWAMWDGQGAVPAGPVGPGDTFTVDFENGMPAGWTTIDANNDGYGWVLGSQVGGVYLIAGASLAGTGHNSSNDLICSGSYSNYTSQAITPDNYLVSPQVNIANGSTFSFYACAQDASYAAEHFGVFVSDNGTSDWTAVQEWTMTAKSGGEVMSYGRDGETRAQGSWHQYTVDLSAFAGQKYIAIRHFNCYDQFILDVDDIELSVGRSDERHLEFYKVMCESLDHEPIFNVNTTHNFCQVATDALIEGEHYLCKVAAVYSTGQSAWTECEWQYISCENYAGTVNGVEVNGGEISWEYPGGGGGGQGGQGDTFTVDFEAGLPTGWTVIDGNNDGYTWCLTSAIPSTWTYYAGMTLDWYHGGSNAICSGSYINGVGALNPDEYLVSPQVGLTNGSTLSFWVAATDASYAADHFGVFISDNGTSDWTSVQEWTLTAKKEGMMGGAASRNGEGLRLGTWYNYSVDLSAYAGQKYIAFRHFNCYDMYIMCLDDIALTIGSKGNRTELAFNGFVTDPGAMANGADASWIKGSQSTWGPNVNNGGGYMLADSFTLDAATTVNEIEVYAYQTGSSSTSTFTGMYAQIYNGSPMSGGTAVWGDMNTNIMTATAFTNCYRGSDGETTATTRPIMSVTASGLDIQLEAGTYYLVYSLTGSGSSGPWGAPHCEPVIGNTGNGLQYTTSGWTTLTDSGAGTTYGCAMKLSGSNGGGQGPTPSGDILGAMIFADGEWEAFVEYPTNTYTYEGDAEQICVRIVYNGTNNLPEGNIYYSMSCEECNEVVPGCAAGDPIHGQYQWNEGGVCGSLIWWGEQPQPAVFEWYFYDNGVNEDAIGTNGGNFWWGVKFPAGSYTGNQITKVAAYDYMAMTGTVTIYNDGASTPTTAVGQTNVTFTGSEDFVEFEFASPVNIDPTKPVWVVLYNGSGATFPASVCANTGDANGRWVSLDGSTWEDLAGYGLDYTFMVRAYIGSGAKGEVSVISVGDQPAGYGTLSNAGMAKATPVRAQIVSYNIYRSTEAAGPYDLIANVPAEAGQTYYEYFDEIAAGDYYYQVTAVYDNGCESDPAMAFGGNDDFVLVTVTSVGEDVNKIALYPNPTNGNVKIEAKDMTHVTVVSVLGQVVYDAEVSGDEYELNMGQYNAGVYVVRIATENGVSTQRVTVVK